MKMGGTRRGFAQGQIRARHEDSPKGGEFRACQGARARATMGMKMGGGRLGVSRRGKLEPGTEIRQKAANSEPGTGLRRAHRLGIFEGGWLVFAPFTKSRRALPGPTFIPPGEAAPHELTVTELD
ncbi:hypothetical protein SBA3_1080003 [Candidatus Sulfopaludibacter sp. SbA3]|nr:hypothetical protein SBA3_1080003 [Candidatus Sulfopaludibacter sp. SbA3]